MSEFHIVAQVAQTVSPSLAICWIERESLKNGLICIQYASRGTINLEHIWEANACSTVGSLMVSGSVDNGIVSCTFLTVATAWHIL